jgi:hypothetical protein
MIAVKQDPDDPTRCLIADAIDAYLGVHQGVAMLENCSRCVWQPSPASSCGISGGATTLCGVSRTRPARLGVRRSR